MLPGSSPRLVPALGFLCFPHYLHSPLHRQPRQAMAQTGLSPPHVAELTVLGEDSRILRFAFGTQEASLQRSYSPQHRPSRGLSLLSMLKAELQFQITITVPFSPNSPRTASKNSSNRGPLLFIPLTTAHQRPAPSLPALTDIRGRQSERGSKGAFPPSGVWREGARSGRWRAVWRRCLPGLVLYRRSQGTRVTA